MGPMRFGYTIIEMVAALALMIILASIALPPIGRALDAAAVREAADRYTTVHHAARRLASARSRLVRLELDSARGRVVVSVKRSPAAWDTVETRPLGTASLETTQPVITFAPSGLGFGLSNSRIVFRRGAAVETLTVARTGRLKRW